MAANERFRGTALSRTDDPRNNKIIITMQRLHVDDLSGVMIEAGWPAIVCRRLRPRMPTMR
jgi:hypothetical protein